MFLALRDGRLVVGVVYDAPIPPIGMDACIVPDATPVLFSFGMIKRLPSQVSFEIGDLSWRRSGASFRMDDKTKSCRETGTDNSKVASRRA